MPLIPGTLPTNYKYPSNVQSLLETFASYMTAPAAKKVVFISGVETNVPTDGSALWLDTDNGTLNGFWSGAWRTIIGQNIVTASLSHFNTTATIASGQSNALAGNAGAAALTSPGITPRSAANKMLVRAYLPSCSISGASAYPATLTVGLMSGTESTCFAATSAAYSSATDLRPIVVEGIHSPNATTAVTYTLRVGSSSGTTYLSGTSTTSDLFGSSGNIIMTIQELPA